MIQHKKIECDGFIFMKVLPPLMKTYKSNYFILFRTFTQVSIQWQDTDSMREELDDLQVFYLYDVII